MSLVELKKQVLKCTQCELHLTKQNYVFGEGDEKTKILFIGEAPGANEDKEGRPFCGKAGKILDEMLGSINLNRGDVYITNILKCRPPNNRDPKTNEIVLCTPYLNQQINVIRPKIIITLGNYATSYILQSYNIKHEKAISKLHGKIFQVNTLFGIIKIIPMYHPATATYAPEMKKVLLQDMKIIKEEMK